MGLVDLGQEGMALCPGDIAQVFLAAREAVIEIIFFPWLVSHVLISQIGHLAKPLPSWLGGGGGLLWGGWGSGPSPPPEFVSNPDSALLYPWSDSTGKFFLQ